MAARFPSVLAALLDYDPAAKLITGIERLTDTAWRVSYFDSDKRAFEFVYREDDNG